LCQAIQVRFLSYIIIVFPLVNISFDKITENLYGLPFCFDSSSLCGLECLSPNGSTMSFSLSSPPCHISFDVTSPLTDYKKVKEILNMTISPSVFSPKEFPYPKLLKKRDYYSRDVDNFESLNFSPS
jgi:hypothetical protein